MDWSRLPRKFLPSWVDAPRCRGRARTLLVSYGHDLTRELQLISFNLDRATSDPQRHAAEGLQPASMGEGTGRNTKSTVTVFPTDESMYGALTRIVQPPRCWQREAGASQRYAR
jgi:hypothetical protein